jgi:hypothetical protein
MTIDAFKTLKKGDRVYIPSPNGDRRLTSTEVLSIDRLFNKATVLLGRKPYSYRYLRKAPGSGWSTGFCVGLC